MATLLLNTIYTLYKSRIKTVVFGLEPIDGEQEDNRYFSNVPVLQIVDSGFNGIQFTFDKWVDFKKIFDDITRHFEDEDDDLHDLWAYSNGWTLRLWLKDIVDCVNKR